MFLYMLVKRQCCSLPGVLHPATLYLGGQVARANAEQGGGAKKTLAGAVQMFRELSHSTVALIAGKSEDADEDPEYLKVLQGW